MLAMMAWRSDVGAYAIMLASPVPSSSSSSYPSEYLYSSSLLSSLVWGQVGTPDHGFWASVGGGNGGWRGVGWGGRGWVFPYPY